MWEESHKIDTFAEKLRSSSVKHSVPAVLVDACMTAGDAESLAQAFERIGTWATGAVVDFEDVRTSLVSLARSKQESCNFYDREVALSFAATLKIVKGKPKGTKAQLSNIGIRMFQHASFVTPSMDGVHPNFLRQFCDMHSDDKARACKAMDEIRALARSTGNMGAKEQNDKGCAAQDARDQICSGTGIDHIFYVVVSTKDTDIQSRALGLLINVSMHDEVERVIYAKGGLELAYAIFHTAEHTCALVAKKAVKLVVNLCFNRATREEAVQDKNVLSFLLAAQRFGEDLPSARALVMLLNIPANRRLFTTGPEAEQFAQAWLAFAHHEEKDVNWRAVRIANLLYGNDASLANSGLFRSSQLPWHRLVEERDIKGARELQAKYQYSRGA